jgi:hypothetical protein
MADAYDNDYGIELKTWSAAKNGESNKNSYYVRVWVWSHLRRVIERDGLISLQVTLHQEDRGCYTCKERVIYVKEVLAEQNVPCFWTREPDDGCLYVTVGPLPQHTSVEKYLSFLLVLPINRYTSQEKGRRQTKGSSRKRRHVVQ